MMRAQCTNPVRSDTGAARRFELSKSSRMPRHWVKVEALVRVLRNSNPSLLLANNGGLEVRYTNSWKIEICVMQYGER